MNVVSFEPKNPRFVARRFKKPINRKTKVNLVFDEKARQDYLTGFQKRNVERRQRNEERFKLKLKEEKKRIKKEAKESYKKLVKSYEPIPEVEQLLSEEHDLPSHSVSILELNTADIARENCWIGKNQVQYEEDKEEDNAEGEEDGGLDIKGMSLQRERDVKKLIMKQSTEMVKQSKVYKQKNKMEGIKNKKRAVTKKKLEKQEMKRKNIKTKKKNLKKKKK
uniref:Nucleolar protein 12 n=1 Tax=Cacopsylla melanoneura TaxID=428564 RepID=A0A8D8VWM9_9HEMI